jgi:general secretion pathway protein B
MSLILEALKKSEQQRRLGEAPTLGSPVVSTRRRRSTLPVLAALIVIAAGAGWWLTRQPAQPSATTTPAPPIAVEQAGPDKPNGTQATNPGQTAPASQERLKAEAAAKRKAEQAKRIEALAASKQNAPLGLPNPANNAAMPAQRKPGDPLPHTMPPQKTLPTPKPAKTGATAAAPKSDAATPQAAQAATTPAAKPATPPVAPPTTPPAPAKAAPAAAPDVAALPTIWELPFSTRKDIPALDLSMHVYSSDPKERFVVIKGERHVEGDEIGSDLTLREIRQDGLVLDYKGQKFFFPRNGR